MEDMEGTFVETELEAKLYEFMGNVFARETGSDVLGQARLKSPGLGWAFVGLGYNELLN